MVGSLLTLLTPPTSISPRFRIRPSTPPESEKGCRTRLQLQHRFIPRYVISTRVRTGRSVRGIRLPPSVTFEERRELERIIVKGLLNLKEELKGDYYPLHGSKSYEPKPGGMTREQEEDMRENHFLFQEPDSTLLLSSGMGRHWPDARGIFHNDEKNFLVWVN
ncbi:Creatine kinase S-type, mitochondrial, partial [Perkinsus olseni]